MVFCWKNCIYLIFIFNCHCNSFSTTTLCTECWSLNSLDIAILRKCHYDIFIRNGISRIKFSDCARMNLRTTWVIILIFISVSSFQIMVATRAGVSSILRRSAISAIFSINSSSIFLRSNPASLWSCISKMAVACFSEREKLDINAAWASSLVLESRIVWMTASILSRAILSHSRICARASAWASS